VKTVKHIASLGWTVLLHSLNSPVFVPSDFHLFGPIKDGLYGQQFPSNEAVIAVVKQWVPSLVPIFMSMACRVLFITAKNAKVMVVMMLKNSVL